MDATVALLAEKIKQVEFRKYVVTIRYEAPVMLDAGPVDEMHFGSMAATNAQNDMVKRTANLRIDTIIL